jgi:hypothetical protein
MRKTWVRARNGRDSTIGATTLFFSVVSVNLQLGCCLDEFGDVVAAKEQPATLPSSGRAFGRPYAEKSRTSRRTVWVRVGRVRYVVGWES